MFLPNNLHIFSIKKKIIFCLLSKLNNTVIETIIFRQKLCFCILKFFNFGNHLIIQFLNKKTKKMKKFILLATILSIVASIQAQDCFKYYPSKPGMVIEQSSYDKKDKLVATTKTTVLNRRTEEGAEIIKYKVESHAVESDTTFENVYEVKCDNDTIYFELGNLFDESIYENQGLETKISGDVLTTPSNLVEGQELKGGAMSIEISKEGETVMSVEVTISNRKVESIGKIKTPAGNFKAAKISYDVLTVMGFIKTKSHVVEWLNEDYGNLKTENYDKKGKLQSYQVVTNITE